MVKYGIVSTVRLRLLLVINLMKTTINTMMKALLIYWLDKLIYGWGDTMPGTRDEDPVAWDSMQKELKELKKLRKWADKL